MPDCPYLHTHLLTLTYRPTYTQLHTTCMHTYTHMSAHIPYTRTCYITAQTHITFINTNIHTRMHTYIHTCIHTYIHNTYIHTCIRTPHTHICTYITYATYITYTIHHIRHIHHMHYTHRIHDIHTCLHTRIHTRMRTYRQYIHTCITQIAHITYSVPMGLDNAHPHPRQHPNPSRQRHNVEPMLVILHA